MNAGSKQASNRVRTPAPPDLPMGDDTRANDAPARSMHASSVLSWPWNRDTPQGWIIGRS